MADPRVPLTRFAQTSILIMIALVVILDAVLIVAFLNGSPDHQDIIDQFETDRNQLTFVACLLAIPDSEMSADAVAGCQVRK